MVKRRRERRKVGLFPSFLFAGCFSLPPPYDRLSSSSSLDDQKKFAPVISPRGEDSELFIYLLCQSGLIGHIWGEGSSVRMLARIYIYIIPRASGVV